MKGHIRERSPGRWAIVIDIRDDEGKRRRKWHSFRGTKREAQVECSRLITEARGGAFVDPGRITVAEYLDRWLEHMRSQVSPRTHECYGETISAHLKPALGGIRLSKVRSADIAKAYADALESGRRSREGGLSPRSVVMMHRTLHQALKQAVRWNLMTNNPAAAVRPPRVERKQMQVLDTNNTVALIEAARSSVLLMPVVLNVLVGLRRGEVAALRWRSVDLERGQLAVVASIEQTKLGTREKPPKSGRARTVALPALAVGGTSPASSATGPGYAAVGRKGHRRHPRLLDGGRRAVAPPQHHAPVYQIHSSERAAARPAPRSAAQPRHAPVGGERSPEGRSGAPWACRHQHDYEPVFPRHAGDAGGRCGPH